MPAKYRVKQYISGGTYYIYNWSRDEEGVFRNTEDFEKFKQLLKRYLEKYQLYPQTGFKEEKPYIMRHKEKMSLTGIVEIWAYSLNRRGYRILVKQHQEKGITQLMRRVITNYVMYFNKKYHTRGSPFENIYRAVLVTDIRQAVWLSVFIHSPLIHRMVQRYGIVETVTENMDEYINYSSYNNYVSNLRDDWIKTDEIIKEFDISFKDKWRTYTEMVKFSKHPWKEKIGVISNL